LSKTPTAMMGPCPVKMMTIHKLKRAAVLLKKKLRMVRDSLICHFNITTGDAVLLQVVLVSP